MLKKYWKRILVISAIILLIFVVGLFLIKNGKKNFNSNPSNPNSLGKELKKLMEISEVKETYLTHQEKRGKTSLEEIKPDDEKSELTVFYHSSFFVENSPETFSVFEWSDGEKQVRIAISNKNPLLPKMEKHGVKLKFKISFFGKDVQKHWKAGRKIGGGYWSDYWYFDEHNLNFQLEKLSHSIQWENSQPLNSAFLGKWKIELRKSVESGFAKINAKIRRRIDKELSRDCYTNAVKYGNKSLEIEIKEENGLVQIFGGSRYTIFWIKNLDDYTMACFTNYHPNSHFGILEDDALLTIFRLDKSKKNLTVFHPTIVEDVCRSIGIDGEKILGWVPFTRNREYDRLKPYFRENARIIATKID